MPASSQPDWSVIRQDFPILHQEVHGKPLIYFDNAATSQKPRAVLDALMHYYERDNANVHRGIHELSMRATNGYEGARERTANFINAGKSCEIIFTRGTTESINLVANTWGMANLKEGDIILLTEMEHHSNIVPWQLIAKRTGAKLAYVPVTGDEGQLDFEALDKLFTPQVKLFAFTQASNTLGTVNPAKELCAKARALGITTLVDAAQSIGHMPVDVQDIGCDFLVFSGHKMCGPTGIGVLWGREELLEKMPPWQGGGDMISSVDFFESRWNTLPHKFEAGTPDISGPIALHTAMDYLDAIGRDKIFAHDQELAAYAYQRLKEIPHLRAFGPHSGRSGLVSFVLPEVHAHDVVTLADHRGLALRGGHHCNQPLMRKLNVNSTARASFYFYNTMDEIDRMIVILLEIQQYFSRGS
ncbi:MAG: cysteine desulfurase [Verrucomicrobia bacterium]|nr:cysteine desulfurase [Verrucomicrobiota bacterium]